MQNVTQHEDAENADEMVKTVEVGQIGLSDLASPDTEKAQVLAAIPPNCIPDLLPSDEEEVSEVCVVMFTTVHCTILIVKFN